MGRDDSDREDSSVDNELDWFFKNASPNPERVGCPSFETLREIASKRRPINDAGYVHLEQCSPCYQEFRRLQKQAQPVYTQRMLSLAAVLLLLVAGAAIYAWISQYGKNSGTSPPIASHTPTEMAVLDLRRFVVTRGGQQSDNHPPLTLSRTSTRLDILLPVGFEPGSYDLRLVDSNLQTALSSQVLAFMQENIAMVRTQLVVGQLPAGSYQLALRRPGQDWSFFPTTVK